MTKLRNYFLDFSNILIETYSETGLAPARANIKLPTFLNQHNLTLYQVSM